MKLYIQNILPYLAGSIGSFSVYQQSYKIYKTNKTRDISLYSYIISFISTLLWIIYGLFIHDFNISIASSFYLFPTIYIIIKKIAHLQFDELELTINDDEISHNSDDSNFYYDNVYNALKHTSFNN